MDTIESLCVPGSPRRDGNSDALAERFCTAAEARGSAVTTVSLAEKRISGCRNLFWCKTDLEHCGQSDDLTLGFEARHTVRAEGVREPGDVTRHPAAQAQCDAVADAVYG